MGLERYEDKVSERELRRLLGQRFEAEHLDFKEKLNPRSKKALLELCKDVIAMANSGGGHVVFGVRDGDFEPVGLSDTDRLDEADLRNMLDKYVDERIDFLLAYHKLQIDDQQRLFAVLYVAPFATPPVVTAKIGQYQDGRRSRTAFSEAAILVRSGSRSLPAQPKEVRAFFRDAGPTVQSLHQLPEPPLVFKGRREELERLSASVREGSAALWALQGLGGIGKTALALKLGQQLTLDYPDAQIFLDLRGTSSPLAPAEAMRHVIHTFHPGAQMPQSESERAGLYRSVLRGKRALLVLDDAAEADQVRPLLPPPSCALLVTSRQRFRLPAVQVLNLGVLDREEAQDLLRDIAPRVADSAANIAELCGCLPLALELAATALAERVDLAPADYARRLRDKRQRLELVDASLSLSYDLLDDRLQRLWARLAVFSIPF